MLSRFQVKSIGLYGKCKFVVRSMATQEQVDAVNRPNMDELIRRSIERKKDVENGSFVNTRPSNNIAPTIHQTMAGRRRFYKDVGVQEVPEEPGHFRVTLDGRILKTPARMPLHLPNAEIAFCIAAEWDAQTTHKGLEPVSMPIMTLASTAIDQIAVEPQTTIQNCLNYLPTDSSLFHTGDEDRILLLKQKQTYAPVVRWVNRQLQIDLGTTQSMYGRLQHKEEDVRKIKAVMSNMDNFTLACLQSATYECKSLVLGLAYIGRYLTLDQAKAASRLEEEFQLEIWGVVEGGHDMDRLNNSVNLSSVGLFMNMYYTTEQMNSMLNSWKNVKA